MIRRTRTQAHARVKGRINSDVKRQYEEACIKTNPSNLTNPCRDLRLSRNFTVGQMAQLLGISSNAVVRSEQGFYKDPPEVYEVSLDQYHSWQRSQRYLHYRVFGSISSLVFKPEQHPLLVLLNHWCYPDGTPVGHKLNPTELSKLLCLNQSVLNYWQNRVAQQQTPPRQFLDALKENGYSDTDLSLLVAAYENHRLFKGFGPVKTLSSSVQTYDNWRESIKEALK